MPSIWSLRPEQSFLAERQKKLRISDLEIMSRAHERLKISKEILSESDHAVAALRLPLRTR
jgi:hypothetical protein